MSPRRVNATRADIIAMLREGHGNNRIARELRCDKARVACIRIELGLPNVVQQPLTLEQKWSAYTRPVDGGHLEWTGEHAKRSGTPVMRYKEVGYSPAAIAFEIRHGRPPQGYVKADCGRQHCVAPDHVNDEAGRRRARQDVRAQNGLGAVPATCVSGHDLTEHAKFMADGTAYCGLCKALDKQAQRDPAQPRRPRLRPTSIGEAFLRHTEPLDDGHVRWAGSTAHTTPTVWFEGSIRSAYKVAFRLHNGRDPEGLAKPSCSMPLCVAGAHQEDRLMRQQRQRKEQEAQRGEKRLDRLYRGIFGDAA